MGTIVRLQLQRNFAEFIFARRDRLPSVIYEMERLQCIHCKALHFLSPRFEPVERHFGTWRAFLMLSGHETSRRTYGKDNRILHTAKLSQGFKVVPPSRIWQGAGVSTGGTKIGVTGSETGIAKLRLSNVKEQS
jgi:hypothetical protein